MLAGLGRPNVCEALLQQLGVSNAIHVFKPKARPDNPLHPPMLSTLPYRSFRVAAICSSGVMSAKVVGGSAAT